MQHWLREAGADHPGVTGGYKAMRTFLIDTLEEGRRAVRFRGAGRYDRHRQDRGAGNGSQRLGSGRPRQSSRVECRKACYRPGHGFERFAERLLQSLNTIHTRLGGERHQRLRALMSAALDERRGSGSKDLHRTWIEGVLREDYYPMYAHQPQAEGERVELVGDIEAVGQYLAERGG